MKRGWVCTKLQVPAEAAAANKATIKTTKTGRLRMVVGV